MIERVLVANRGEVAKRVARTCLTMGITPIGIFSDADADASWVLAFSESIAIGGKTPTDSYLDIEAVIFAAQLANADAVHPGYGFLAESEAFARACEEAGLAFIGPRSETIALMGNKVEAKGIMEVAGIPVLGDRPFPVLVKAAAGGGGTGMVSVATESELEAAKQKASRIAEATFGDGTVFVERQVESPRHIEVQVAADEHGNVATIFERDCSTQRRFQKLIEEAPAPELGDDLRQRLFGAAKDACRAVNYVGVGTVEFLVADDEFFFLEMNTRLQVEHGVTELIAAIDLVQVQLDIANGSPLPGEVIEPRAVGHAIEARLYAEEPQSNFTPSSGQLDLLEISADRVDATYESGDRVSEFYDPLIAKVMCFGRTRLEAIQKLRRAIATARVHGVVTNQQLLGQLLDDERFRDGTHTTNLVAQCLNATSPSLDFEPDHAAAAAMVAHYDQRSTLPARPVEHLLAGRQDTYTVTTTITDASFELDVNGEAIAGRVWKRGDDLVDIQLGQRRMSLRISHSPQGWTVDSEQGSSRLAHHRPSSLPTEGDGQVRSPISGRIVSVDVAAGSVVAEGDRLMTIEIMKMERLVEAPVAGIIESVTVQVGDHVEAGQPLTLISGV